MTPKPILPPSAATTPTAPDRRAGGAFPRRVGLLVGLLATAAVLTGCTGGPGSQDDFVEILMRDDGFTVNEADCIAGAVFDEYGDDGDALGLISGAESYEVLNGPDGVDGFEDFFTVTVSECTTVGPTP